MMENIFSGQMFYKSASLTPLVALGELFHSKHVLSFLKPTTVLSQAGACVDGSYKTGRSPFNGSVNMTNKLTLLHHVVLVSQSVFPYSAGVLLTMLTKWGPSICSSVEGTKHVFSGICFYLITNN